MSTAGTRRTRRSSSPGSATACGFGRTRLWSTGSSRSAWPTCGWPESLGYAIKLLAVVRLHDDRRIEVRVQPTLIPRSHILSSVNDVFNAVAVRGDIVGETLFYGSGAGQNATSSAVIADLVDAAHNLDKGVGCQGFLPSGYYGRAIPVEETVSAYYVRLRVEDRPGVVAELATVIAAHGLGLSSLVQPQVEAGGRADIMLMTHAAPFGNMTAALAELGKLSCVCERPILMRGRTIHRLSGGG